MRTSFVWYVLSAAAATMLTIGAAGSDECCKQALPRVVYALPPIPTTIPPTGYVLNPSDAAKPVYPVNSYFAGYGSFARPTYSEGGYAYADSYPYTDDPYGYRSQGYWPPAYGPSAYGGPRRTTILQGPAITAASTCGPPARRRTRPIATGWRRARRLFTCSRESDAGHRFAHPTEL
jgi:hypothetical protein